MRMPRVLVVATSRKTRGGITAVIKAHEKGGQWNEYRCYWVQTHRDGPAWRKMWYFMSGLVEFFLLLPFCDIVHIHTSNSTSAKRKCYFVRVARLFKKRIIIHFHAFDTESSITGPYSYRYEYLFKQADKVIVLSEWWKERVQEVVRLPEDRIQILYNPCPETGREIIEKENEFLYAGTVNARKGYADLIRAFAKIAAKYPDWKVVIAGNGEIEQGRYLAEQLGLSERVVFLGWVSGNKKDQAFRKAEVFCLPSYAEGFPMAVLDAWAYGLPVITTPVGGIPDVARDGENMLLFDPGNIHLLAKQMERLIKDVDLRAKISAASRDFANNKFNIRVINVQLGKLYAELSAPTPA